MNFTPTLTADKNGWVVNLNITNDYETIGYNNTTPTDNGSIWLYRVTPIIGALSWNTSNTVEIIYVSSIGYVSMSSGEKIELFAPDNNFQSCSRMMTKDGIGCFRLVELSDAKASRVRISTTNGIKAFQKR